MINNNKGAKKNNLITPHDKHPPSFTNFENISKKLKQ